MTAPADPAVAVTPKETLTTAFWRALDQPGGVSRAVQLFHEARGRDPQAPLFTEALINQVGYEQLQAGKTKDAVDLFTLNVEVYPTSANAQDSLGDGYLADGQNALALAAARKALELLPADKGAEQLKDAIRQSAQQKIDKLTVTVDR